ncbi:MAG: metallophosphoesterase family protein [Lentisphaeria bacterium]|nr:metallophosphatase family protein [Lentisphaeria bacterium]NQZ67058.1 metallophosphoesterase family protein [Lentisphaeria bacterium]
MKYAIFGDVHANLEALTRVLEECEKLGVEKYLCIGDIVGYNADPSECLNLVRNLPLAGVVMGNHDEQASEDNELVGFNPQAAFAIEWTRNQLTDEERDYLKKLRLSIQIGKITIVHATLDSPRRWGYIFDKHSAGASFSYQFSQLCFCGHSHVPLAFEKFGTIMGGKYQNIKVQPGHKYLVNVGSVGQPRDGDWRSAFVVYDTDENDIQLHRLEYDIKTAQQKILDAGLPERLALRLERGQ